MGYAAFFIYLFYFWLCWVFLAVRGLSLVVASRGYSLLRCAGFSLRWPLLLWSMGSRHTGFSSCGNRLNSCGVRAWLLCGMWDLPGPGLESMSPALAGRFLTTVPLGEPQLCRAAPEILPLWDHPLPYPNSILLLEGNISISSVEIL